MRSLLVGSQKGGVGKTTTAVNLAALAGAAGARVLLLDADPLGSVAASLQLADGPRRTDPVTGAGALWPAALPGVDVATPYPAADTSERHLQAFLDALPRSAAARGYDLLVIDAPPMLGPRPKALLRAADQLVVVQRAEPMSIRTLPAYLGLVQQARAEGGACRLAGVLLTLPEGMPAGGAAESAIRAKFPGLLPASVPYDPQVGRALVLGRPLVVTNPDSAAARVYADLADQLGLAAAVPAAAARVAVPTAPARVAVPTAPARVAVAEEPPARRPRSDDTPPPYVRPARPPAENPLSLPVDVKDADDEGASPWLVALAAVVLAFAAGAGAWVIFAR